MNAASDQMHYARRLVVVKVFVLLSLALLLVRLWYLQGIRGTYYRDLSENNRIRRIRTEAPRGNILDREGRVFVRNRPAFNVALMREDTPDIPETVKLLAAITKRDEAKLLKQYKTGKKSRPFEPKAVLHDVSREELARVTVNRYRLPGVIIAEKPTRAYPYGTAGAQILGYTRELSKEQFELLREKGYWLGDSVGKTGLEKQFESVLRGKPGYVEVEVDAKGNRTDELGIVDNLPGRDVQLTIDLDLQQAAEKALDGRRGAVVALDPRNGEVLALASGPSFDANIFSGQMLAQEWDSLVSNPDKPLTNRAIAAVYPPGSTIKLLWSVAGLSRGKITPKSHHYCPGYVKIGRRRYHCHKRSGHGEVTLAQAVTMSCNAFFYHLGQAMGIDGMTQYMAMFGFGRPTGIQLPGEEGGTLPSKAWKLSRFKQRWYPGDTVPVSIGQGYLVVTPLQMASVVATIANDGRLYRPSILKKIVDPINGEEELIEPKFLGKLPIDPWIFEEVRTYAGLVVNHKRGTGWRTKFDEVEVGGKTGTAQVVAEGKGSSEERFKDHAWFVALAPVSKPTIALAVIVENSGHGGVFAAPVAKKVLEAYFLKRGLISEIVESETSGGSDGVSED